jgi:hypothetical protein
MVIMHCPRCGLTIRLRSLYLTVDYCPRCIARAKRAIPLTRSGTSACETASAQPSRRVASYVS